MIETNIIPFINNHFLLMANDTQIYKNKVKSSYEVCSVFVKNINFR